MISGVLYASLIAWVIVFFLQQELVPGIIDTTMKVTDRITGWKQLILPTQVSLFFLLWGHILFWVAEKIAKFFASCHCLY